MRTSILIPLPFMLFSLSACDVASEMAGDALKEQVRTEFISRCEQIAQDNGITSQKTGTACGCAADDLAADASDGSLDLNQDKIIEMLRTCSADVANDGNGPAAETQPAQ